MDKLKIEGLMQKIVRHCVEEGNRGNKIAFLVLSDLDNIDEARDDMIMCIPILSSEPGDTSAPGELPDWMGHLRERPISTVVLAMLTTALSKAIAVIAAAEEPNPGELSLKKMFRAINTCISTAALIYSRDSAVKQEFTPHELSEWMGSMVLSIVAEGYEREKLAESALAALNSYHGN